MADSILCSINMAGGAINIYYDTVLAQGNLSSNRNENSISLPSGWKTVIIMSCRHVYNSEIHVLIQPFPIFIETSYNIQMPVLYNNGGNAYIQSMYAFARITSNRLYISTYIDASYIVAT